MYTTSEVLDLACDSFSDESQFLTDTSSSGDSDSDFDLSDPEAESQLNDLPPGVDEEEMSDEEGIEDESVDEG